MAGHYYSTAPLPPGPPPDGTAHAWYNQPADDYSGYLQRHNPPNYQESLQLTYPGYKDYDSSHYENETNNHIQNGGNMSQHSSRREERKVNPPGGYYYNLSENEKEDEMDEYFKRNKKKKNSFRGFFSKFKKFISLRRMNVVFEGNEIDFEERDVTVIDKSDVETRLYKDGLNQEQYKYGNNLYPDLSKYDPNLPSDGALMLPYDGALDNTYISIGRDSYGQETYVPQSPLDVNRNSGKFVSFEDEQFKNIRQNRKVFSNDYEIQNRQVPEVNETNVSDDMREASRRIYDENYNDYKKQHFVERSYSFGGAGHEDYNYVGRRDVNPRGRGYGRSFSTGDDRVRYQKYRADREYERNANIFRQDPFKYLQPEAIVTHGYGDTDLDLHVAYVEQRHNLDTQTDNYDGTPEGEGYYGRSSGEARGDGNTTSSQVERRTSTPPPALPPKSEKLDHALAGQGGNYFRRSSGNTGELSEGEVFEAEFNARDVNAGEMGAKGWNGSHGGSMNAPGEPVVVENVENGRRSRSHSGGTGNDSGMSSTAGGSIYAVREEDNEGMITTQAQNYFDSTGEATASIAEGYNSLQPSAIGAGQNEGPEAEGNTLNDNAI